MNRRERRSKVFCSTTVTCKSDVPKNNTQCQASTDVKSNNNSRFWPWTGSYKSAGVDYCLEVSKHDAKGIIALVPIPFPDSFCCLPCGKEFDSHRSLKAHLKTSCLKADVDFVFFCDQCHDKFPTVKTAKKHVSTSHSEISHAELTEYAKEKIEDIHISDAQLSSVDHDDWLGDEAVDLGLLQLTMKWLQKRSDGPKFFPVSCLFRDSLLAFSKGSSFGQLMFLLWFLSIDSLFIPVNHERNHWSLIIVDNVNKSFYHCDSIPSTNHSQRAKWVTKTLQQFTLARFSSDRFSAYNFIEKSVPRQMDGHNCGVHVVFNAESHIEGHDMDQSPEACRKWRVNFVKGAAVHPVTSIPQQVHAPIIDLRSPVNRSTPKDSAMPNSQHNVSFQGFFKNTHLGCVIQRVPKGARVSAAWALTHVLNRVVSENSDLSWQRLFSFPSLCLSRPPKEVKCRNLTTYIKDSIQAFEQDKGLIQLDAPDHASSKRKQRAKKNDIAKYLKQKVSAKINMGDVKGAIRLLSSDDTFATKDSATTQALKDKHPIGHIPEAFKLGDQSHVQSSTPRQVRNSVVSFNPGSSGGPDGLCPQHLKDLTASVLGATSDSLLQSIASFCNFVSLGKVKESVVPTFFGARLIALKKKCGGIRPIAIGMTLRRLCSKLANTQILAKATDAFQPHQVGFGVKNGAEAAIHALSHFWEKNRGSDKVILKIDFKNAFNAISRSKVLETIKNEFPEIFPLILSSYGTPSYLQWEKEVFLSSEGVQQGDPSGPFLFCAGIRHMVENLKSELNIWYLDDGTLAGDPKTVIADFQKVIEMGEKIGLSVNPAKCEVFALANDTSGQNSLDMFRTLAASIKTPSLENAVLLGGSLRPEAVSRLLSDKHATLKKMCENLKLIDSHEAIYLLKNSLALPKLTYLLRSSPCFDCPVLFDLDETLRLSLESLLNTKIDLETWDRASLPLSLGGLGIRKPSVIALPAYVSSQHASLYLTKKMLGDSNSAGYENRLEHSIKAYKLRSNDEIPPNDSLSVQKRWDRIVCHQRYEQLLTNSKSDADRASMLAGASSHSGSWLNALPASSLGLKLNNDQVRVAVGIRIGARVCEEHTCICGSTMDPYGHHALSCGKLPGRRIRHSQVNMIIHRALNTAQIPSVLEPPGLSRTDGKRPDGKSLVPWKNGRSLVWDFTCSDTVAPSNVNVSAKSAGNTADLAEKRKRSKYTNLTDQYVFIPVAVESFGTWGSDGKAFVSQLGARLKEATGEQRSAEYLFQSISMAVQRGNSINILAASGIGEVLDLEDLN